MDYILLFLVLSTAMGLLSSIISLFLGVSAVTVTLLTYRLMYNFQKKMELRINNAITDVQGEILKSIADPKTLAPFGQTIIDGMVSVLQDKTATAAIRESVVNGVKGLWGSVVKAHKPSAGEVVADTVSKMFTPREATDEIQNEVQKVQ
jgi:fatty acid/phospholipid biosynthesis enzyme